jgi:hypothetical protein
MLPTRRVNGPDETGSWRPLPASSARLPRPAHLNGEVRTPEHWPVHARVLACWLPTARRSAPYERPHHRPCPGWPPAARDLKAPFRSRQERPRVSPTQAACRRAAPTGRDHDPPYRPKTSLARWPSEVRAGRREALVKPHDRRVSAARMATTGRCDPGGSAARGHRSSRRSRRSNPTIPSIQPGDPVDPTRRSRVLGIGRLTRQGRNLQEIDRRLHFLCSKRVARAG